MGETGHTVASTLDSVVGTTERLCGLPAVATLDWSGRAAQALSVLLAPSRACVMIVKAEPSGRIVSLEASGSGSCVSRADAAEPPAGNWSSNDPESGDDESGVELGVRSRADRLRELGFRLEGLAPSATIAATAARLGGTELWRTAPIGTIWVGSDISDLLIGAVRLDARTPARFLIVEIGLLGHGAAGPRRASIDNQSALAAILPLLARRAGVALGADAGDEISWLTVREQQVLEQLVLGKSVRTIADELGRSPHTVHDHVKSLHRKLGASSRGELIARALGYLEPEAAAQDHGPAAHRTPDAGTEHEEGSPPEIVVRSGGVSTRYTED
jgi:DNA-binding CsgD family transcriptional regulator